MLRHGIHLLHRLARELGWIHHYHSSHGLTSLRDLYLCYIGFVPDTYAIYNLAENDYKKYISDKTRFFGLPRTHGDYMTVLQDKSLFYATLKEAGFEAHLPRRHAHLPPQQLDELSLEDGTYILKPLCGSGGYDVHEVYVEGGILEVEGDRARLQEKFREEQFVLEDKIENAPYADDIFSNALNTIRIYTAWDYHHDKPFIASAYHRFGTSASAPADNRSSGGIDATINLEAGRLGSAFVMDESGQIEMYDTHPETNSQIRGVQITKWHEIQKLVLNVASHLNTNGFIGWDCVVDAEDRLIIIEANSTPDLRSAQRERPMLEDPRVEAFLAHHSLL